ncbi:MAG: hypothetical protein KatS3mg104_0145 [Phycisphaerae bacterium]|nr:MAG: hypothetical protein KatS3mg104_0145 [Phycisphaerae bacterium]
MTSSRLILTRTKTRLSMFFTPRQPIGHWLMVILLVSVIGCQNNKSIKQSTSAVRDYFDGDFARAMQKLQNLAQTTDENYVLNNLRLGSVALTSYELNESENAFLRAWEVINAGGVNSGARSVAAVWIDEKLKIWKGEPYERALASFYLGLVYYIQRDYNNARAAFENALFKLRDYADPEKKSNDYTEQESTFVLAHLMLGRTYLRLGRDDLARESFEKARQLQPRLARLAEPSVHTDSNVLLVVDFGYGPKKVTDYDGTIVGFAPTPESAGRLPTPRVIVDGQDYPLGSLGEPTIDTLVMALDRRWQSIDTIRTVKTTVGTGLIAAGAGYGVYKGAKGNFDVQDAAIVAGLIATGAILKATSQADTRQWEMVPRTVYLLPLRLPPGRHDITVQFPEMSHLQQQWMGLVASDREEYTYYMRMNRWWPGPWYWPPKTFSTAEP